MWSTQESLTRPLWVAAGCSVDRECGDLYNRRIIMTMTSWPTVLGGDAILIYVNAYPPQD